jgi:acetyl esterase/lipase
VDALAQIESAEADSPTFVDHLISVSESGVIDARWYSRTDASRVRPSSTHGGGMIAGSVELNDWFVTRYVETTGVPFRSVDYRLAPEISGTCLVDDACPRTPVSR